MNGTIKRAVLGAVCGCAAASVLAAPDLDAVLLHESTSVSADGVTRTASYRERMVRRDGHVWVERVLPAAADGAHAHRHADASPGKGGVRSVAADAHAGHKHFDFASASRHVTNDGKTVRIEYVNAAERTVVDVPPAEYETTGFDGSWDNAYFITPPSQLKKLDATAKPGSAPGTRWYAQQVATANANGVNRILWSDALQAPLAIEYRSADGRIARKLTLTPATRVATAPWQRLMGYARKEYADFLD
ncbi:hypothetical protein [Burkholderia alba]|uniref:hypothetical protein n=1 Tax=Burkholderia alba TaxID=2683677 RepID=UPI002B05591E|nr:hypothetical protein [Burkholderia alba]